MWVSYARWLFYMDIVLMKDRNQVGTIPDPQTYIKVEFTLFYEK